MRVQLLLTNCPCPPLDLKPTEPIKPGDMSVALAVWVPIHTLNFRFIPLHYRMPFMSVAGIVERTLVFCERERERERERGMGVDYSANVGTIGLVHSIASACFNSIGVL